MDIIVKNFIKVMINLIYIKKIQCTNGKVLEFLNVVHLFLNRGRKHTEKNRVPIDNIKASGSRRQAKRRCFWVGLIIALRLVDLAALTFRFCEASAIAQGVEEIFGCTARQARYAESKPKLGKIEFTNSTIEKYNSKRTTL